MKLMTLNLRKTTFAIALFCSLNTLANGPGDQLKLEGTINITGTRFLFPLLEKWGEEFSKANPGVKFVVKQGLANPDINASAAPLKEKDPAKGNYTIVSRFAIVPIVNEKNPGLAKLQKSGFKAKDFESVYFSSSTGKDKFAAFGDQPVSFKVYSRSACTSATFSSVLGEELKDLTNSGGKRIADDQVLLKTVADDPLGVAYNDLGIVYDLKTRKPKPGIAVVPTDLNGDGVIGKEESFYADLDQLIHSLESISTTLPPKGNFTLIYKDTRPEVTAFVNWVLTEGQQYVHEYGFLNKI
ncbi:hypothetical protein OQX61_02705 [Pedobacter sp. PLR]|uniref:PstS family phosphate ABC transporter substrate-binding protein n=1 Tax=Pedobacter sp. PLR TaxID=2994465 RepID=UPI0022451C89|nr:hypothetical protein [Pedobacter sp. PLR]MCX2450171.1 hypothetical protein [Pedobacter sp. PLR]